MDGPEYVVVWDFVVRAEHVDEFVSTYGPHGAWARLFARDATYLGTELLVDRSRPLRFLTIDRWISREAYACFRETHAREYAELDARCAEWTEREVSLGEFAAKPRGTIHQ